MKPNFTHKTISLVAAVVFAILMTATCSRLALAQTNTFPTSGNAGVGTTTPADPLDVSVNQNSAATVVGINNSSGGVSAQAVLSFFEGSTQKVKFAVNSSGASSFVGGANAFQIWNFMNSPIVFGTNSAERMRIDSGGNVGIGTTNPGNYKLNVNGSLYGTATYTSYVADGLFGATALPTRISTYNSNGGILFGYEDLGLGDYSPRVGFQQTYDATGSPYITSTKASIGLVRNGNFTIKGGPSNTEFLRIDNSGNVGIGTTSPGYKLDVSGNINAAGTFQSLNTASTTIGFRDGDEIYRAHSFWVGNTNANGGMFAGLTNYPGANTAVVNDGIFFVPAYVNNWNQWVPTLSIRGTSANGPGNVGIGITTPGYKLDVQGGQINSSGGFCIAGDCKTAWSQVGGGGSSQWSGTGPIYYNSGSVGIGTSQPAGKLHVSGNTGGYTGIFLDDTATGGRQYGIESTDSANGIGGGKFAIFDGTAGIQRLTIDSGGKVGIGTTSPGSKLSVESAGLSSGGIVDFNLGESYAAYRTAILRYTNGAGTAANSKVMLFNGGDNSDTGIAIVGGGNVGIGTITPGYRLEVNGEINATGLRINGTPISSGGGSSQWTGTSNIYYNGGNVGIAIGSSSPTSNLQIGTQTPISTPAPTTLSLGASFSNSAGSNLKLKLYDDGVGSNTYGIGVSSASMDFGVHPSAGYHWYAGGVNKMTLANNGDLSVSGNISAKYQDVAEWVPSAEKLAVGTVVVLDSTKSNQVTSSTTSYDTRVAGVISEQPGIALGEKSDNKVLVATTGRVRVRVDASKSPINIGDLLVTSDIPGLAMKSEPVNLGGVQIHRPGTLIGKALEPLAKGSGEILVLLSLQ